MSIYLYGSDSSDPYIPVGQASRLFTHYTLLPFEIKNLSFSLSPRRERVKVRGNFHSDRRGTAISSCALHLAPCIFYFNIFLINSLMES